MPSGRKVRFIALVQCTSIQLLTSLSCVGGEAAPNHWNAVRGSLIFHLVGTSATLPSYTGDALRSTNTLSGNHLRGYRSRRNPPHPVSTGSHHSHAMVHTVPTCHRLCLDLHPIHYGPGCSSEHIFREGRRVDAGPAIILAVSETKTFVTLPFSLLITLRIAGDRLSIGGD
jgi:hypothetical protein